MAFANNSDPDETPGNMGPHLRSRMFDTQIVYWQKTDSKQLFFAKFYRFSFVFRLLRVNSFTSNHEKK